MLARAAARARSRSVRLPSRLPSSRTWMRMQSTLDLGIELVDGDRGGRQPVKQLGWGAPAAVAVATQEGGQAGLAQPLGGLRGPIALQTSSAMSLSRRAKMALRLASGPPAGR